MNTSSSSSLPNFWSKRMWNISQQTESILIYLIGTLVVLLRNLLVQGLYDVGHVQKWELFSLDFCTVVVPMLLAQSFFADHLPLMVLVLLALCLSLALSFLCFSARCSGIVPLRAMRPLRVDSARAQRDANTLFRALLLITTALAILAVDFTLFPRRLAKTQYYGHSLMDTGTAAFVFVNALADHDCRTRGQSPRQRAAKATMQIFCFRVPVLLALFLIGVGRSLFVHFSGYGQDVAEYGVHWNFFITLFCLRVFVILVPQPLLIPVGVLLGVGYQLVLRLTDLEHWILRDGPASSRHGIIDQNREGIFSMFGYCFCYALSLIYCRHSSWVLSRHKKLSLCGVAIGCWVSLVFYAAQRIMEFHFGILASRRLANIPYCFAMLALFSGVYSLLLLFQVAQPLPHQSQNVKGGLLEAVSRNALLHFLIANLMTGLINILIIGHLNVHGHLLSETVVMLGYALASSLIIYLIHLAKKLPPQQQPLQRSSLLNDHHH